MESTEFTARRRLLTGQLGEHNLDAFIVSAAPNIRYLSGFTGGAGLLLISGGAPVLLTDPRYEIQASQQSDCRVRVVRGPLIRALASIIRRRRLKKIGFEASRICFAVFESLRDALPLGAELEPTGGVVEQQRLVKSPREIELIRRSVEICSKAFSRAARRIRPGMREYELAAELDYQMRKCGAEKPAFQTIVASGSRSALPHAEPTAKILDNNELLLIDMGAQRQGYTSDMTRMVHLGRPSRKARQLHRAVLEAQLAALDAVKENATASSIDRAARRLLRAQGLDSLFAHSTGHGLGLEVHEPPRLGKGEKTRLKAGMVITVEPGVYMEEFGGVRIEDTVVVTKTGCEILTPTPKELLVV